MSEMTPMGSDSRCTMWGLLTSAVIFACHQVGIHLPFLIPGCLWQGSLSPSVIPAVCGGYPSERNPRWIPDERCREWRSREIPNYAFV